MSATSETIAEMKAKDVSLDIDRVFREHYSRVTRIIARVVRDQARAEELAVEVFLRLWRNPITPSECVMPWLYRVALRVALDELRRRMRRLKYETVFFRLGLRHFPPTPEQIHHITQNQERVRFVLSCLTSRQAEFLLLRSQDFSYHEIASILDLNPPSVGTLLARAQQAFRREYVKRYGQE